MTPKIKQLIAKRASANEIQEQAVKEGMNTLKMSAISYVKEGITSIAEVKRITFE